ncbi:MAG: UDP-N-acetylmuramoyl-L-alanyl-D-glutamate--2,6-diaminopimelate ligase [Paludibacteraceae bacterium]|nr:UDP-N-acetylmuramoyl-L-alanyl-D-glutamate--2,6-diaminopimelate ligase [Paludibacteraceae bacterium]
MNLSEILNGRNVLNNTSTDVEVKNVCFYSRKVTKGDVFVATRGTAVDGHDFIAKAVEQGTLAVVCEELPENLSKDVTYVQVADSADALGVMASNFYENPSQNLTLVGVTGTNGKTTIATLLYQLFRAMGYKVGLLSTVCNYINDEAVESTHTTPDALALNALLARMVDAGCEYAFMEVSSHSVEQRRIAGLKFRGGIFTNLTRDHLDYHKTVENYLRAKKRFFDELPKIAFALTNLDDKNGEVMLQNCVAEKKTYSLRTLANFKTRILENSFDGMLLEMNGREVMMPFVGKFNAANLSAVFGAAVLLGFDELEVLTKLSSLKSVSGRFETIRHEGVTAIVDYAHTPDALNNVISTINDIRAGEGNLITVVGCGGNRDKGKRPMMAREAVNGSNRVILTSDNPRDEDPQDILNDMLEGVDASERRKVLVIADRREAIKTACALAQRGDVILVAGKGHENYQIIKGVKHHFDDKEEIQLAINNQ